MIRGVVGDDDCADVAMALAIDKKSVRGGLTAGMLRLDPLTADRCHPLQAATCSP